MQHKMNLVNTIQFRDDKMEHQQFLGQKFIHHRYFNRQIHNCHFDKCKFEDLRMWNTQITKTTFENCDLRHAAIGGIAEGKANRLHEVIFRKTDLRNIACLSAEFIGCKFDNCKFGPVDFHGSRFTRCIFTGQINDTLFYDKEPSPEFYCPKQLPW